MYLYAVSASADNKIRPCTSLVLPHVILGHRAQQTCRRTRQIAVSTKAPKNKTPVAGDLVLPYLDTTYMAEKRKASSELGGRKGGRPGPLVNPRRMRVLQDGEAGKGPILYWYDPILVLIEVDIFEN
jgi:hypothetical protein